MNAPTLSDVARVLAAPGMTEHQAEELHGFAVLVDCHSGRAVPVQTDCANGCTGPSCEGCAGLEVDRG